MTDATEGALARVRATIDAGAIGLAADLRSILAHIDAQAAEIEQLRAELAEYKEAARTWENEADRRSRRYEACVAERDAAYYKTLQYDLDCLHANAERYRCLRDAATGLIEFAETGHITGTTIADRVRVDALIGKLRDVLAEEQK